MNIEQAKASVGKRVLCFNRYLKSKELWIASTNESEDGYCVVLHDESGKPYDVKPSEIDFLPEQEDKQNKIIGNLSVKIDADEIKQMLENVGLRKEIAFLLIQHGHDVDHYFKDKVDTVFDAITL